MMNMRVLRHFMPAFLLGTSLHAAVVVIPIVTPTGSNAIYEYTVFHNQLEIIGLEILLPSEALSLFTPAGWVSNQTPYDASYLVQWFTEGSGILPGSSMSGFAVELTSHPGNVPFTAYDTDLNSFTGMSVAATPEPSTKNLVAAACGLLLARRFMKLPLATANNNT